MKNFDQSTLEILNQFHVNSVRKDFPILQQLGHGHPFVYLDNAATTQKPQAVIEATSHFYREINANIHRGIYLFSERATKAFEAVREKLKQFINARESREIIFVRGATEAINLVAHSYGRSQLKAEDEILITEMEHHSNIVPWQLLAEETGAVLRIAPINDLGELDINAYQTLLTSKTKIVALAHISNALGTINPVRELVSMAHAVGAVVLVDGAQAVPHMSVDVQQLDADFYVFSSHKLFGPTGVGVLYGKADLLSLMPPYQAGGDMISQVSFEKTTYKDIPYKFEAGTPNIAGVIGLGAAIDYLCKFDMNTIFHYEKALLAYATEAVSNIRSLKIIGNAKNKAGILSFTLENIHPHDISTILDHRGIAIRAGHHCAMPVMEHFKLPATARVSFAFYNTTAEIDLFVEGLFKVIEVFQ